MKTLLFWFWTAFCLLGTIVLVGLVTRDNDYNGTDVVFTTGDSQLVSLDAKAAVVLEAASDRFFALRNGTETVIGVLAPKPLGWDRAEYYTAGPVEIKNGTWIVEKGTGVTVHLNSPENMVVQEVLKDGNKAGIVFGVVMIGVLVWLLGLHFGVT